ncbi:zinc finger transcription factor YY1 isoform X2 [Carica papaya]|uniref:zinc finger transcription factor YY1 isoform X2 n=1 Tax=Carica papaya TaxID=3649 RepID=UPI000B8C806D|nr:zinc finger transcription factor YY1 isoform X2 [Carica papaya]
METQFAHNLFDRRPILKSKTPAVKWFREWVPQDVVATGGKCFLMKWVTEDTLKKLKEKAKEPEAPEPEPEPTTEVLFLCSYEGCGKTFIDAGALRKHSHIHGERQYVCHYEGCGKKFLDSSKLKRHFLIHTGERDFVCPHEGCDCGKRYAHEYKLKNHISSQHEKNPTVEVVKYTTPPEKISKTPKPPAGVYGSGSLDRPYACPYDGCEKAYIHEYKLKLHLRREHPGHMSEENAENATLNADNEMDEGSDQDAYGKRVNVKSQKQQGRSKPNLKMPPAKMRRRKGLSPSPATLNVVKKPWLVKEQTFEEDSEETEEERDNVDDGWRYGDNNEDDEETEYED